MECGAIAEGRLFITAAGRPEEPRMILHLEHAFLFSAARAAATNSRVSVRAWLAGAMNVWLLCSASFGHYAFSRALRATA